ncbi:MAG: hypothetical protein DRO15_00140 [Thermoprotei archaeon]|nr:MAG: hypothetical protein DRO15_00140 [Thermoprotei archaeon]
MVYRVSRHLLVSLLIAFIILIFLATSATSESERKGVLVSLSTNIDGGAVSLIEKGINSAKNRNAVLILEINTYGGYLAAADKIIELIKSERIECYSWIPPGSKAISAGSLIALACKEIYMGPGSVIGAAKPIPSTDEKVINYVAGRFKSLAEEMFKGNKTLTDIAEKFVRENLVLTDKEAYEIGFARKATNLDELTEKLDIEIVDEINPGLWERILSVISDPYISNIMLFLGVFLIVLEVLITGFQGYVVAGILLIILSLYGMAVVPANMLAAALLVGGAVLLIAELYTPGFGVFGISGFILVGVGAYLLFTSEPYMVFGALQITTIALLVIGVGFMIFIGYKASKTIRMKKPKIEERIVGQEGVAKTDIEPTKPGVAYVAGEDWTALSIDEKIRAGEKVIVVEMKGLVLKEKRAGKETE